MNFAGSGRLRIITVLTWVVLGAVSALAQFDSATLTGVVTDAAGAVVSAATVKTIDESTNLETSASTNNEGRFLFSNLRPGSYRIEASAKGFKQFISPGFVLQVNQAARLDMQLTVGEVTEQVTVTAEALVLETETASRGAVIDHTKIVELPLNGRDYNQLALLSPGVLTPTPRLQSIGFRGAFNVNGNRAFQNGFQLDGVDNTSYSNSFRGLNMQVIQPSIEALQEFKIQTNAYSAEFGRSAGALVNDVIRSAPMSCMARFMSSCETATWTQVICFEQKQSAEAVPPAQPVWSCRRRPHRQEQDVYLRRL
jgi:hypothetical protein